MTTPREDDRAAQLARQLNEAGIKTDPGMLGGVVIYATAAQAEVFLASLVPAEPGALQQAAEFFGFSGPDAIPNLREWARGPAPLPPLPGTGGTR